MDQQAAAQSLAVRCRGVFLTYGGRSGQVQALDNISIDIPAGQFLCIVGPSGCGKSSLLGLIAGLRECSAGQVETLGVTVREPVTDLGMVFQKDLLLPWRTSLQNVMLQGEMRDLPAAATEANARHLLALVGLEGFEDKLPHELSGGMRQRCAVVRALVHNPPLLLMDEPFAAVDALTRDQLNMDLLSLWSEHRPTVILVTHSIDEAVYLGDRVMVMSNRPGRILADIPIELPRPRDLELKDAPEFRKYTRQIRALLDSVAAPRRPVKTNG
jgi:NitT/TauT family transport system ATP-binding protein